MTSITGKSVKTAGEMRDYLLSKNNIPKLNGADLLEFCTAFIKEGEAENIRGDIAFCQAIKETGWFKYGGQVLSEQNNFCGLGALNQYENQTGKGAWFKTYVEGIRAQIQHLKAYAATDSLKNACVDPRFHLVARASAPNWEDLNGKWAVPGIGYGEDILKIYNEIKTTDKITSESGQQIIPPTITENKTSNPKDLIDKLDSVYSEIAEELQKKDAEIKRLKKKLLDIKSLTDN